MVKLIKKDNNGSRFLAKIIDCQASQPFNLDDVVNQFIVFYKPNGIVFEKQGTIIEDLPNNPGQFFIQYVNDLPEKSILDLRNSWEYTGKVELDTGDFAEASTRIVFWVV